MKGSLKVVIYIIFVICISLICCLIFIKPKVLDFKAIEEYGYIINNKKDIEKIVIRNEAQLGESCYNLDVEKGYDILNNIDIKKETKLWCSTPYIYFEFYFKDGVKKEFFFECENLVYNGLRYELKDKVRLFNKDEYMPDTINDGMIIVSNKDKIDCNEL